MAKGGAYKRRDIDKRPPVKFGSPISGGHGAVRLVPKKPPPKSKKAK